MRKIRVIIIDDEDVILSSFKRWLSKSFYEVLTFNNPTVCPLCKKKTKMINAKRFHDEIENVLKSYCSDLQCPDWSAPI